MLIGLQEKALRIQQWPDKQALLESLSANDGALILGQDAAQEAEFYSVLVRYNYAGRVSQKLNQSVQSWGIGIIAEGQGVKPELVILNDQTLVVGFNHEVVGIDLDERRQVFKHSFDSLFHAFLHRPKEKILLVISEIGTLVLDETGNKLWDFENDIVTAVSILGYQIELEFMDSAAVVLDLLTGARLPDGNPSPT